MISIRGVSKAFGRVQAVDNVSLEVPKGEFFSLLGPSGCGKTTLLRMIAGFEAVSSGSILIDGEPMQDMPPHLRPTNMVFQNYAIFPHLNVRDNIGYGLRRLAIPRAQQEGMVDEMLDLIALPGYGDRTASQLSGGQMQRVALARALILKPKVLLLDEPLGALDKQLREQMQVELHNLQQKLGITFVLVTHDQEEAMALSDRIAVMHKGSVIQVDDPKGLYEKPGNRIVANFVGNMNFFDATIRWKSGAPAVEIDHLGMQVLNGPVDKRRDGERVLVALRPENIFVHRSVKTKKSESVSGEIRSMQYLGNRRIIHVEVAGRAAPIAVAVGGKPSAFEAEFSRGDRVWLSWERDAVIILDNDESSEIATK